MFSTKIILFISSFFNRQLPHTTFQLLFSSRMKTWTPLFQPGRNLHSSPTPPTGKINRDELTDDRFLVEPCADPDHLIHPWQVPDVRSDNEKERVSAHNARFTRIIAGHAS
jgi:hypothetical protein